MSFDDGYFFLPIKRIYVLTFGGYYLGSSTIHSYFLETEALDPILFVSFFCDYNCLDSICKMGVGLMYY